MKIKFFGFTIKSHRNMALKDSTPITGWEKWINRIVTAALAVWQAVSYLIAHWASNPPVQ